MMLKIQIRMATEKAMPKTQATVKEETFLEELVKKKRAAAKAIIF